MSPITRLANGAAVCGGIILILLALMTLVSILGRALFSMPVPGDYELMETGCAIAAFAFLPYAQVTGHHIIVAFFSRHWPAPLCHFLDTVAHLTFSLIAALLFWRAAHGGLNFYRDGDTSMILALPVWWAFPTIVFCLAILILTCLQSAYRSWQQLKAQPAGNSR